MADSKPSPNSSSQPGLHLVVRLRWLMIALFAAACALLLPGTSKILHDDDVLAFLPPDDPDVVAFQQSAQRYGMLDVGLVGLARDDGATLLTAQDTAAVRGLATKLGEIDGIKMVLSFVDVPDPNVTDAPVARIAISRADAGTDVAGLADVRDLGVNTAPVTAETRCGPDLPREDPHLG